MGSWQNLPLIPLKYPNRQNNSTEVMNCWGQMVQHQLHDVQQIQSAEHAFAAIRSDGRVVTWGNGPSVRLKTAKTLPETISSTYM